MDRLKLPNFGELGMDIKKILWETDPKTYNEFISYNLIEFDDKITKYLKKRKISVLKKYDYQQILLYMNFVNYKKEKQLLEALNKQGWNLFPTSTFDDMKYKIDLQGKHKNGNKVYIQVKPKEEDLSNHDLNILLNKAKKDNATPYIAFKKNNIWKVNKLIK
ncbi:hypothetical protein [Mycoplasma sp. Z244C]